MSYYTFGNLKSRLATTFSLSILGIFVYNNYHILPSFDDIKLLIVSKLNLNKTIKETPDENIESNEDHSNIEDPSGNLFSDSV